MVSLNAPIRIYRPSSGLPDPDSDEVKDSASKYELVTSGLMKKGVPEKKCTPQQIARYVAEIRRFLDRKLGEQAERKEGSPTIFPARLFYDLAERGSLACMLNACFGYAREKGIANLKFADEKSDDISLAMIVKAEKALKAGRHLRTVKAYMAESLSERDSERVRSILQRHGANLVSSVDVATHIIYSDPNGSREHQTDDQVLIRILEEQDDKSRVHWLHHPDSYDDWVPSEEVLGRVYEVRQRDPDEQWHVHARWVRDLDLFNEWMNELDYEMPPDFKGFIGRPPKDAHTKEIPKVHLTLRMKEENGENEVEPDNLPDTLSLPANGSTAEISDKRSDDEPEDNEKNNNDKQVNNDEMNDNEETMEKENENDDDGTRQQLRISLGGGAFMPHFSKWFTIDAIHDIEKRALPEYFCEDFTSKTESNYKQIRNFMVETWRRNPDLHLSGTAARRHLAGDACSILRIHGFLEHWGLINYLCSSDSAPPPSFTPPPRPLPLCDYDHEESEKAHVRKRRRLFLDNGSKAEVLNMRVLKYGRTNEPINEMPNAAVLGQSTLTGITNQIQRRQSRAPIEYHCDSCGADCSGLRFHCATKADVDLCASCYYGQKYSSTMKPRDFIQMNSATATSEYMDDDEVWTENETILLLEALEMFADNWTLVSEHVGSKAKDQCVTQFLRLPIEDLYLSRTTTDWWSVSPGDHGEYPSPVQIMRQAGCREAALASILAKESPAKAFSGQAIVYGDQISTIVPFVGEMSSAADEDAANKIIRAMGLHNLYHGPTIELVHSRSASTIPDENEGGTTDKVSKGPTEEEAKVMVSDKEYKEAIKKAATPVNVLESDYGVKLCNAAGSFGRTGGMPFTTAAGLRVNTETLQQITESFSPSEQQSPEKRSSSAESMLAALVAACSSVAGRRAIEEIELLRLQRLAVGARAGMVRRKAAHLEAISKFEVQSREYKSANRIRTAVQRALRKVGENPTPKTTSIETIKVAALKFDDKSLIDCKDMETSTHDKEWVDEDIKELPNFDNDELLVNPREIAEQQRVATNSIAEKELTVEGDRDIEMTDANGIDPTDTVVAEGQTSNEEPLANGESHS